MTTIQIGRAYPFDGPELRTVRDIRGKRYDFKVAHISFLRHDVVVVHGQDKLGVWCKREYKAKHAPKWLKKGIRNVRP